MSTKSENALNINTYGLYARPVIYEPICNECDVVELRGPHNVVMARFPVRPLYFQYIYFIGHLMGSYSNKSLIKWQKYGYNEKIRV